MSMVIEATRMSDFIKLPNSEEGAVKVVSAVADANGLDLRTIGDTVANSAQQGQEGLGVVGHYITIQADGADIWIKSGKTQADVTGANAPSPTATGVGIIGTPIAGASFKIPKETERSFYPTPDHPWLGFIGSGGGYIRIFKTSY